MRVTIDTGAETDDILARAYLAAVVGPTRRPNGRGKAIGPLNPGGTAQVSRNGTPNRVLFVTVSATLQSQARFSSGVDANSGFEATFGSGTPQNFILLPGEQLTITNTGIVALPLVFVLENTF